MEKKSNYYLGVVAVIEDDDLLPNAKEYREILVDIPEIATHVKAFPKSGELDEPKVGDPVLLLDLDPLFHSYMIYEKIKENDFIGFRASGKMVDITPDRIIVGVFKEDVYNYKEDAKWDDDGQREPGDGSIKDSHISHISIEKNGNITIEIGADEGASLDDPEGKATVFIKGDANITIDEGNSNVTLQNGNATVDIQSGTYDLKVKGACNIKCEDSVNIEAKSDCSVKAQSNVNIEAQSKCTVKGTSGVEVNSPQVKITGGQCSMNGTAAPSGSGPFCGLPACLFTGAPHVGNMVAGT